MIVGFLTFMRNSVASNGDRLPRCTKATLSDRRHTLSTVSVDLISRRAAPSLRIQGIELPTLAQASSLHAPLAGRPPESRAFLKYHLGLHQRDWALQATAPVSKAVRQGKRQEKLSSSQARKKNPEGQQQPPQLKEMSIAVEEEGEDYVKPRSKKRRLAGASPRMLELRNLIIQAAKTQDAALAIKAYDDSIAEGIKLPPDSYKSVLYLTAGGESWMAPYQQLPVPWPADAKKKEAISPEQLAFLQKDTDAMIARGQDMLARSKTNCEMSYISLARIAAAGGDGNKAYEAAVEGRRADLPARLRLFLPALLAYAGSKDTQGAFKVRHDLLAANVDLTETEHALLLLACQGSASREQAYRVLNCLSREHTTLSEETVQAAEQLFRSETAAGWLEPSQGWSIETCTVNSEGICSACRGQLQALDLEDNEWDQFADGIANLATSNEKKPHHFKSFQSWLEEHGPFKTIIDGANVAFWGQSFEQGQFQFGQIEKLVDAVCSELDQKPLVVLHKGRLQGGPASTQQAQKLIHRLAEGNMLYSSPYGSNDDWYWIYATVKAGPDAMLISNDKMRDHIFQLLAPKYFHKWKQRHQMTYDFLGNKLHMHKPKVFTVCTQHLDTGSWVFPRADSNEWLCVCPKLQEPSALNDNE